MTSWTSNLSSNSNYDVTLTVNQTSQNIGGNTSNVSWSLVVKKKSGSGYWAADSNASTFSVKIDGTTVSSGQKSYNFTSSTPQSVTVASGSRTITHGADGKKSIACSASWKDNKNGLGTGSPSGTLALTTIPRATQPTVSSKTVALGSAITINLPRASSSFTHRIYYNFFGATGLSDGIANSTNATTSTTFTPPVALANAYMKKTTSNGAAIYVETRNGSTVIGTKSIGITITVPNNSTYNPTLGSVSASEQNAKISSGLSGTWVQGQSKIRVYSPVTMRHGAYAVTARVFIGGAWRAAVLRGSNIEIREDYIPTASGSHPITVEVTDSRSRRATATGSITVAAYSKPRLTVSASRVEGNQKLIALSAVVNGSSLSAKNNISIEAYIRLSTATSWGTAVKTGSTTTDKLDWGITSYGNYSETLSYEVMVRVSDKLTGWSQAIIQISTASVLMDVYKDQGVSFGRMYDPAVGGTMQVGGSITLDGFVNLTNNTALRGKDTSGVDRRLIHKGLDNDVHINPDSHGKTKIWGILDLEKGGNTLWAGTLFMHGTQSVTLNQPLSECPNGIILVWSNYENGNAGNHNYTHTIIHKDILNYGSNIGIHQIVGMTGYQMKTKYLYVSNTKINGNDNNNDGSVVLRKVVSW